MTKPQRKAISKRVRFEVFKRDSFKCQYCGASAPDVILQIDHIHPVAKGGTGDITNLVTSCDTCNSGKSDKVLSDESAAKKRKAQLDHLQERREQLEMMAEWQRGLIDLDEDATRHCVLMIESAIRPYGINKTGIAEIHAHVKKFGMSLVLESIRIGTSYYLKIGADEKPTQESIHVLFAKLGGICTIRKRESEDPNFALLNKIRAVVKKQLNGRYCLDREIMPMLKAVQSWGYSAEEIMAVAARCGSWSGFQESMAGMVADAEGGNR